MATDLSLAELEARARTRFMREGKNEASQVKRYLAEKAGCDPDEIELPSDFKDNLFMIENGAEQLFGPYWAKRIDDDFIVLRTGRRFNRDDYSEVIWEREYEEEDDDLDDDDWDQQKDYDQQEEEEYAVYSSRHAWQAHSTMKAENKTASSLFPDCRVIPYTIELEQKLLWRETEAANKDARKLLEGHIQRGKGWKRLLKFLE